ncbi:MAG: NifU family protein [Rhodomicrobium sp.]
MLDFAEQFETTPELQPETAEDARFKQVADALAGIRPRLQRDGGDCHLVSVEGNVVKVKMSGACVGCQLAFVTVHGIQAKLIEKLGFPVRVVPVPGA